LNKDPPAHRLGQLAAQPILGGLHHYTAGFNSR
jgi:hypothetical protein